MPLSLGKVTVDVSLCGSIPRRQMSMGGNGGEHTDGGARSRLSELTSSKLNICHSAKIRAVFSTADITTTHADVSRDSTLNRYTGKLSDCDSDEPSHQPPSVSQLLKASRTDQATEVKMTSILGTHSRSLMRLSPSPPHIEPPSWAVPARGDARLEPVCEAFGTHQAVALTGQSSFRVGRSPASDIQLWHETSSRRHALIFHHPNGSCYIVDCGSAHGTFVNGKRVRSAPKSGMVMPHRVRRGSLIRFGGPGAPAFVLKSFSTGMSTRIISCNATQEVSKSIVQFNTRLNALGDSVKPVAKSVHGGILRKRSFEDVTNQNPYKRQRCTSPPTSPPEQLRLVSPDNISVRALAAPFLPALTTKRVTFNDIPEAFYPALVTPDALSSEDESSVGSNN